MKLIIDIDNETVAAYATVLGFPKEGIDKFKSFLSKNELMEVDVEDIKDKRVKQGVALTCMALFYLKLTEDGYMPSLNQIMSATLKALKISRQRYSAIQHTMQSKAIDVRRLYSSVAKSFGYSAAVIAHSLGKDETTVTYYLRQHRSFLSVYKEERELFAQIKDSLEKYKDVL